VSQKHVEDGVRLGQWVSVQRSTKDKLTPERRQQLEALPGWAWDGKTTVWDRNYALLCDYAAEHGHANVTYSCVYGGVKLGQWVRGQRSNNAKGKLSEEHRQKLEKVRGWRWVVR
jgi:hypothetical protein